MYRSLVRVGLIAGLMALGACEPPKARPIPVSSPELIQVPDVRVISVRTRDHLTLAVEERGPESAPAILFVHGLAHSRVSWMRQLEGSLAREFHLVAYDLRGHGQSDRPTGDEFYSEGHRWGDDLAAVIEATHLRKPVVVAWSLGGVVVANYLRDHGDSNLGGLVFVDAVTHFSPELFGAANPGLTGPLQSPDAISRAEASRKFIKACFAVPPGPGELDRMLQGAGVLPAEVHAAIMHISIEGGDQALRSVRVPTLVIHGGRDELVLPLMGRRTASLIPGATLSLLERAGHAPFFDEAAQFNDQLTQFVRRARR